MLVLRLGPSGELTLIIIPWGLKFSGGPVAWTWHYHGGSGLTPGLGTKTLQIMGFYSVAKKKQQKQNLPKQAKPKTNDKNKTEQNIKNKHTNKKADTQIQS